MEEIDLKELLEYFKKSILLFFVIVFIVIIFGSAYSLFIKKPEYKSRATVILSSDQAKTITQNEVTINKNLVDTYTAVVKSHRVLDKVREKLDLDLDYDHLSKKISVSAVKDTEIIEITVVDALPLNSKTIADTTANIFVEEISALFNVKNINVLDHAIEPDAPHNINLLREELIYLVAGIILASGVIFIIFYFDRTIKTPDQIERLKLPLIGKIRKLKQEKGKTEELILKTNPKARINEDFRTIRTNLRFSLSNKDSRTVLITSTIPGEGKSFTASNLAMAFAKSGKKVLLIDSDLRFGRIHEIFELNNTSGLSDLLADHQTTNYNKFITKTKITNLSVITRGDVPPNPSELLDSLDMDHLLSKVKTKFDYVFLDGAPISDLSDSLILAKKAKRIILICSSGHTATDDLVEAKKSLDLVNANLAGVILNQVSEKKHKNGYNKYYI